jgi:catechol 2,3-dioxygenase-like lactoylglutathione lyase family enzyme
MIDANLHVRIARPVRHLTTSRAFYVDGLGLTELLAVTGDPARGERDLLLVGVPGASWHLELTASPTDIVIPTPTPEDLLVV